MELKLSVQIVINNYFVAQTHNTIAMYIFLKNQEKCVVKIFQ